MNEQINMSIPMEEMLRQQIYDALQGKVVESILAQAKFNNDDNYWRNMLEGHSFKVDEKILSKLHNLFIEVKQKLNYTEMIDFYVTGDPSVNAFAVAAPEKGKPHIINVNSALVQLMTDDELKFVIGHEIGHLINKNAELSKLIYFVFPEKSNQPVILQYKIRLWNHLSELSADRFGFLAVPDLKTCITAFFKMSSGLDFDRVDMKVEAFIEENMKRLEYFKKDQGVNIKSLS